MSEVTITLGRTGQVVKRKRGDSDVDRSVPIKSNSVRHRLGPSVGGSPSSSGSKRQRGNGGRRMPNADGTKDARLGQKDLRLKLLRKRSSALTKIRNAGANGPKRSDIQDDVSPPPSRSLNHSSRATSGHELRRNRDTMQISARDRGRDLLYRDSPRNYYSSLTRDDLRVRSPARILGNTRSMSPPTPQTDFRRVSSVRPSVTSAPQQIFRNVALDPHNQRPLQPPPMIAPSIMACRPAPPLPPPNGTNQRSVYLGDASNSVPVLLHSLGLSKYVILFQAEEIDMPVLKQMSDKDLKDMLIPMGPRKKILQAVMGISRRPPAPAPPLLPLRPL